ncbi:hypothetical protein C5167_004744 [Papaver somniferum]|uniref:Uncharacterized protein n=1 Tax=Papaver somniferum TaxID=3469 RepID=A0A4Y7JAB6_PAPSO|nr:uncharacterized protein LOC113273584 [Papaver somniferum]RZC57446.1 hypothetical protein C5167_004744 [Papaver somniferum]
MAMRQQQQPGRRRSMEDHLCGLWTNEKHVNFLNWMEDSFVRTMLIDHRNNNNTYRNNDNDKNSDSRTHQLLRLDRFLPDSSESTRDLRRQHHKITTTAKYSVVDADPDTATSAREDEEMTCLSLRPYDSSASSSNDQVVPQFGMIKAGGGVDDDDEDDNMADEEEEEKKG